MTSMLCRVGLHRWRYRKAHSDYPTLGIRQNYYVRSCGRCGTQVKAPLVPRWGRRRRLTTLPSADGFQRALEREAGR